MKKVDFEHDVNRVSKTLDFSANGQGIVYSGPGNMQRAEKFAHVNNVKTISDTEGGRYACSSVLEQQATRKAPLACNMN